MEYREIVSGGVSKDSIPSIDDPKFKPVLEIDHLEPGEPVIGLIVNGEARAYPLRVLMWHEIVNDTVGGVPAAVTYCPLNNQFTVYDRRVGNRVLEFGTTGKLRKSDLVMYDRQTATWWQQFTSSAIIGEMAGTSLTILPSRLESWKNFRQRAPQGTVLVPSNPKLRDYGRNPYLAYDTQEKPLLYDGAMPDGIKPLARVISLEKRDQAWSLALLETKKELRLEDGTVMRWEAGQVSAVDTREIGKGREVGNVTAQRDGKDIPYFVDFAFAFHAFYPEAPIHTR